MQWGLALRKRYSYHACTCIIDPLNRKVQFRIFVQIIVQISQFYQDFHNHKILPITMNNQWWKYSDCEDQAQALNEPIPADENLEMMFQSSGEDKQKKTLTIFESFKCDQEVQFVRTMAKFAEVFSVSIDEIECLRKLSENEKNLMKKSHVESMLVDIKRSHYTIPFKKSFIPKLSVTATLGKSSGIVFIIQSSEEQQQKCNIKILNYENLIHTILGNVNIGQNNDTLKKELQNKFKNVDNVICFDRRQHQNNSKQFLSFLLQYFSSVVYLANSGQQIQLYSQLSYNKIIQVQNRYIIVSSNNLSVVFKTHVLTTQTEALLMNFYRHYCQINQIINGQINKSKQSVIKFRSNTLCMTLYGIYYNFISMNIKDLRMSKTQIQNKIYQKMISEKEANQKLSQRVMNRPLGHYPQYIIQKGKNTNASKICCVCKTNKSRYRCQLCSHTYRRDIALCIDHHFNQFHNNIGKYLPKGSKKGAIKNQLLQYQNKSEKTEEDRPHEQSNHVSKEDVNSILKKWNQSTQKASQCLNQIGILNYTYSMSTLPYGCNMLKNENQEFPAYNPYWIWPAPKVEYVFKTKEEAQ